MGLCGSSRCGCGITTDGTISISGSGESGDPYLLGMVPVEGLIYEGTASQAFTSLEGPTDITIDTEVFDIGSVGGVGLATFTIPTEGLHVAIISGSRTAGTGRVDVKIDVTTGSARNSTISAESATVSQNSLSVYLAASDVLTLTGTEVNTATATVGVTVRIYRVA